MQKLCRETRVPICTTSTADHAKFPLQQILLDCSPSYIYNCSCVKTLPLIFTTSRHRKIATKGPAQRAWELQSVLPSKRDSAGSLPTMFTGPQRITEDKLQVNTGVSSHTQSIAVLSLAWISCDTDEQAQRSSVQEANWTTSTAPSNNKGC